MKQLLLLSSSKVHGSGYLEYAMDDITEFLQGVKTLVFVPYALKDLDEYTSYPKQVLEPLGINVIGIHTVEDKKALLKEADAIFIGGGNTFRLLHSLYELDLIELIKEQVESGVLKYMGASAGSNVATVSIKTTNDMPIIYPPSFEALNLVPFNINPHYIDPDPSTTHMGESRDTRIAEFHEENNELVIGLREGAWLRVSGDEVVLKGHTAKLFYADGHHEELVENDHITRL